MERNNKQPTPPAPRPRQARPGSRQAQVRETAQHDPSLAAARYRLEKQSRPADGAPATGTPAANTPADEQRKPTADDLRSIAKTSLDLAIERGDFDNLPLAGKPLPGLSGTHDPDWWIKAKIERENLSGVAPPALSLRTENERLDDLLDSVATESSVRATIADFNGRIIDARRQLTGGPPVVTPLRDPDREVARWLERRACRRAEAARLAEVAAAAAPPTWRERRAAARATRTARRR